MLLPHRRILYLGGRSCSYVCPALKMSSDKGQDEIIRIETGAIPTASMPSPKPQQDRTWNSTRGISFAGEKLKHGPSEIKAERRESVYEAMRSAWSSLLFKAQDYSVPDQETVDRTSNKGHIKRDRVLLAQVSSEGGSTPRAGAEQHLGPIKKANNENRAFQNTIAVSSASGLNFQPSQQLACPDLSTSGYLVEDGTFYPVLSIPQSTCRTEDTRIIEKDRSPLESDSGSTPPPKDAPFCTPLGFHIPKAKLQQAMDAKPSSVGAYWQYTLYQGPDGDKDKVKVHYCKSKDTTEQICQLFLDEEVLGFDIEWKMNASAADGVKKNVALIQMASEKRIALFHIARYPNGTTVDDFVAPALKRIMESPSISKVGVSVKGDCTRLRKFMNIESRGIFELSHLYKLVKYSSGDVKKINKLMVSLAQQVQEHLQLPLWKGEVRSSDWSQDLNYRQIQYAASDSYAGFQLYHMLESKRKALDPTPPRPAHAELKLPIRLANGQTVATYEASENVEESSVDAGPDLPISMEELAHDFFNIKLEDSSPNNSTLVPLARRITNNPLNIHKPPEPSSTSSTAVPSSSTKVMHPNVIEANTWLTNYKNSLPIDRKVIAKPSDLRAYHLWYYQGLEVYEIACRLRDPPLAKSTVASYILQAIIAEHLPFHRNRVWAVLPNLHDSIRGVYQAGIMSELKMKSNRRIQSLWKI
ncbi:hypothetical protein N7G274_001580 [Stereocaulon virgatum]|uniref:3'-5' exonuclease domain-containing protein n=1 Tax=Stereocaulon virgatum TaxID=373712 RepID=A0ABR4ARM9_9LECA